MKKLIHRKKLNKITTVNFSYNDVSIEQEGHIVVVDKAEILELAQLIKNEIKDKEFYTLR